MVQSSLHLSGTWLFIGPPPQAMPRFLNGEGIAVGILGVDDLSGDAPLMEAGLDSLCLGGMKSLRIFQQTWISWHFTWFSRHLTSFKHRNSWFGSYTSSCRQDYWLDMLTFGWSNLSHPMCCWSHVFFFCEAFLRFFLRLGILKDKLWSSDHDPKISQFTSRFFSAWTTFLFPQLPTGHQWTSATRWPRNCPEWSALANQRNLWRLVDFLLIEDIFGMIQLISTLMISGFFMHYENFGNFGQSHRTF